MAAVTCEKCDEHYKDPRMLPCLHTFCLACLEKELGTQESRDTLHCPNCKEKVTLTENGSSDLPRDLQKANEAEMARISEKVAGANGQCEACGRSDASGKAVAFCIDCDEFLCTSCNERHRERRKTAEHSVVTADESLSKTKDTGTHCRGPYQMTCSLHKNQMLDVYCKQCQELICKNCMNFKHFDHHKECSLVEEVAEQEIGSLWACLKKEEAAIASLDAAIDRCKQTVQNIETKKRECDASITESLEQVRKVLLAQNEEIRSCKVTALEAQLCELQRVHDGLSHASVATRDSQSHSKAHQLYMKKALEERAATLQTQFQDCLLLPSETDGLNTAVSNPDTISRMIGLACLSGWSHAASSTCDAGYLPRAVVDKPRTVRVVARDKRENPFCHGREKVEAMLTPKDTQVPVIDGNVTDHGDGSYSISFTAKSEGYHELCVTLSDNPVGGSPFTIYVTHPRSTPSTALHYIATNTGPLDVAVTEEEGYLAVTEYKNNTVTLYADSGEKIHSFGAGDKQLKNPSSVACRGDLLYVCEEATGMVQKFSVSKLCFVSKFGSKGHGNGQLSNPRGICVDPEGKVFVADTGSNLVKVFSDDGVPAYSFACEKHPWGLTFDHRGHLHVAAFGSDCIRVFTPEGALLSSYGSIKNPLGIAIDAEGYIAVSDNDGSLFVYSSDHTLINKLSNCGRGIVCDKDDSLWVADCSNNRIVQY